LGNVLFFLNWKTGDGFIPSNLVVSLWSSLGLFILFQFVQGLKIKGFLEVRWDRVAGLTLGLFILVRAFIPSGFSKVSSFEVANKSQFFNAVRTARNEYDKLAFKSVAITTLLWFPFRYFQDIERRREDISIVMASDILAPKYFNPISSNRFPKLKLPQLDPLSTKWYDYMPEFINLNIAEKAVYYEPGFNLLRPIYKNLNPNLFLYQVSPGEKREKISPQILEEFLGNIRSLMAQEFFNESFQNDFNSREYYMTFLLFGAQYLILHGHHREPQVLLKLAEDIHPNQGMIQFYLAQTELALGEVHQGRERLQRLLQREPSFHGPNLILIKYYLKWGDLNEVSYYLSLIPEKKLKDFQVQLFLIEYYWRKGNFNRAKEYLRLALKRARWEEEQEKVKGWETILSDVPSH